MSPRTTLAASTGLLILLSLSSAVTASTSADPEIRDGTGDAQAIMSLWPSELEGMRKQTQANLSAFDITAAYIASESRDHFSIVIDVEDMDEALYSPEAPTEAPVESNEEPQYLHADYEARFTIGATDYLARAAVDLDANTVRSNYTLHRLGEEARYLGQLSGSVDPAEDRITFLFEKAQVGSPADDSKLTRFYVTSGSKGILVDQAPDAKADLTSGKLSTPRFGEDYTFGQYRPDPRAFTLKPQGETSGEATTGEAITFLVALENQASTDEEVLLTTKGLSGGWSVKLDTTLVQLSPGSNKLVTIEVTPGPGAGKVGILIVHGVSTKGDLTRETSFTVRHLQDGATGGGGNGDLTTDNKLGGTNGPEQSLTNGTTDNKDSPGVAALAVVATAAVGLALLRRRQ